MGRNYGPGTRLGYIRDVVIAAGRYDGHPVSRRSQSSSSTAFSAIIRLSLKANLSRYFRTKGTSSTLVFREYSSDPISSSLSANQKIRNSISFASAALLAMYLGLVDSRLDAHRFSFVRMRIDGCRIGMADGQ
jgi:hypothetical protein